MSFGFSGFGFRVSGFGVGFWVFGFRVLGFGFRDEGLEFSSGGVGGTTPISVEPPCITSEGAPKRERQRKSARERERDRETERGAPEGCHERRAPRLLTE